MVLQFEEDLYLCLEIQKLFSLWYIHSLRNSGSKQRKLCLLLLFERIGEQFYSRIRFISRNFYRPLRRMAAGGFLTSAAFVICAVLQFQIEVSFILKSLSTTLRNFKPFLVFSRELTVNFCHYNRLFIYLILYSSRYRRRFQ